MKLFFEKLGITCLYFATLLLAITIILILNGNVDKLVGFDFVYFDSIHYESIKNGHYNGWLVAFFPGFPMLWKFLDLNVVGISCFNFILFIFCVSFFSYKLQIPNWKHLVYLTIPCVFFTALPYSESLFFFSACALILSIKYNLRSLIFISVALCSFTRPVVFVFLPAFTILIGIQFIQTKKISLNYLIGFFGVLFGLGLAFFVQYLNTGIWFEFFQAQSAGWGNSLRLPKLPLSSWSGNFITALDGVSLWISLMFLFCLIHENYQKFICKKNTQRFSEIEQFSLLIIGGTGLLVLLTRGGMLFSLNRFIFLSPCFFVALNAIGKFNPDKKDILKIIFSFILFSLFLGSYGHIRSILIYLGLSIAIGLSIWVLASNKAVFNIRNFILFLVLFLIQAIVVLRTLLHDWVA